MQDSPYIALVGSPNCGKTVLFNQLSGLRHKVANYPGVTVEKKEGKLTLLDQSTHRLVDLPGIYSLNPKTLDEEVTIKVLQEGFGEGLKPQLILFVLDATLLDRQLALLLEVKELGLPMIVALNMMDLAKGRGLQLDDKKLSQILDLPVFPIVATKNQGIKELLEGIAHSLSKSLETNSSSLVASEKIENLNPKEKIKARFQKVDEVLSQVQTKAIGDSLWTKRLDKVFLHPIWGTLLLYVFLAILFQGIFSWSELPMSWIEGYLASLGNFISPYISNSWLGSLILDGVLPGVGSVLVFLPQILFLFLVIFLLEDSGYMARAAFLMDFHMKKVGLTGRAFIPLLSSFACAIPGIMGARTIENQRDRLLTIMISPLMACSARLPVYALLIGAFVPNTQIWGPFRLQGLVLLSLYLFGALSGMALAWVLGKLMKQKANGLFLMELPTYKIPQLKTVLLKIWDRALIFLKRAGTVILAASLAIWFLSTYPKNDFGKSPSLDQSYAGRAGKFLEPLVKPLGFDDKIAVGLLTGIVAREVIVGSLATIYAVEDSDQGEEVQIKNLSEHIKGRWSTATGLSLLVFFIFAMQCLSTLVVVYRETASLKYPMLMFVIMSSLAYVASWVTYSIFS
ncbi:MAG: ferrous iron transport protein B [Deltaproteobacteria bacterium]|nr:ferrous iron transport protein B [Deltaproteobacteria bacterium]